MKLLIKRKLYFTLTQIERLSNIFDNAGQVILGIAVLSPFITGIEKINLFVILSGIVGTISCWLLSLFFAGRKEDYEL